VAGETERNEAVKTKAGVKKAPAFVAFGGLVSRARAGRGDLRCRGAVFPAPLTSLRTRKTGRGPLTALLVAAEEYNFPNAMKHLYWAVRCPGRMWRCRSPYPDA
jgi:hypothetical protein